jgi:hypothetical protein
MTSDDRITLIIGLSQILIIAAAIVGAALWLNSHMDRSCGSGPAQIHCPAPSPQQPDWHGNSINIENY